MYTNLTAILIRNVKGSDASTNEYVCFFSLYLVFFYTKNSVGVPGHVWFIWQGGKEGADMTKRRERQREREA